VSDTRRLRLLVAVKAYPAISKAHNELVCCAGVTEEHDWVRLYPVRYRDLPGQHQFRKGDIIEVLAERPKRHKDDRPESWRPNIETMKIVDHISVEKDNWRKRLGWISPTLSKGFAELAEKQRTENKSLGCFRPSRILGVKVTREASTWTDQQLATINQKDLFSDKEPLEKIPFRFQLEFEDENGGEHCLSIIDWEFFQLWRRQRDELKDEDKAAEQVRRKIQFITSPDRDVIAFAGNLANPTMRKSFMILGFCYPKLDLQQSLF